MSSCPSKPKMRIAAAIEHAVNARPGGQRLQAVADHLGAAQMVLASMTRLGVVRNFGRHALNIATASTGVNAGEIWIATGPLKLSTIPVENPVNNPPVKPRNRL